MAGGSGATSEKMSELSLFCVSIEKLDSKLEVGGGQDLQDGASPQTQQPHSRVTRYGKHFSGKNRSEVVIAGGV